MSLKRKLGAMHDANRYGGGLDFEELCRDYEGRIGRYVTRSASGMKFAWKDAEAMRALTEVLLERDFGIVVKCHPQRLCPALPNRINYLCWINDLLEHWPHEDRKVHILDIGVGATAIYPVLGSKQFGWLFTGSDIDEEALSWARNHVLDNSNDGAITLIKTESSDAAQEIFVDSASDNDNGSLVSCFQALLDKSHTSTGLEQARGPIRRAFHEMSGDFSSTLRRQETELVAKRGSNLSAASNLTSNIGNEDETLLAAVMTNPPFYDLLETIEETAHTVCTGSAIEMRTTGGEVAFIATMVLDSLVLRETVQWYTCMVGKKKSLGRLRDLLGALGVPQVHSTRFHQGRTMRWGLAWSFHGFSAPLMIHTKENGSIWASGRSTKSQVTLSARGLRETMMSSEQTCSSSSSSSYSGSSMVDMAMQRMGASVASLTDMTTAKGYHYRPADNPNPSPSGSSSGSKAGVAGHVGVLAFREEDKDSDASSYIFRVDLWLHVPTDSHWAATAGAGAGAGAGEEAEAEVEVEVQVAGGLASGSAAGMTDKDMSAAQLLSLLGAGLLRTNRKWRRALQQQQQQQE